MSFAPAVVSSPAGAPVAPPRAADMRCFTVTVDARVYGIPVEAIHTVFEIVAVTPVPLAPCEILGLVNLRGKIVTAVSLRRRLGADPRAPESSKLAVGVEHRGEAFALVIDEVGDVLTLDRGGQIDIPPHLGAGALKISSVHRLDDLILPVLDLDWVLSFTRDKEMKLDKDMKHDAVSMGAHG